MLSCFLDAPGSTSLHEKGLGLDMPQKLLVYEALSWLDYYCCCGLKLLVYEALSFRCSELALLLLLWP